MERIILNNVNIGNVVDRNGEIIMFLCADDSGEVTHEIHLSDTGKRILELYVEEQEMMKKFQSK